MERDAGKRSTPQQKDASDYYSLWVHQIKTPISAMHLLIQSFEEQAMEFEEHAEETLNFLNEMKMKIFRRKNMWEWYCLICGWRIWGMI